MKSKTYFLAVFAFCLIFNLPAEAKERKQGVELLVQKKDGEIMKGELLAVRENERTLIILESVTSNDLSLSFDDIEVIRVLKPSRALKGARKGLLYVGTPLVLIQVALKFPEIASYLIAAGVPTVVGGLIGSWQGVDDIIPVRTLPPEKKEFILNKLKPQAFYASGLPADFEAVKEELKAKRLQSSAGFGLQEGMNPKLKSLIQASPYSRIHFGLDLAYFNSHGMNHYLNVFKNIGFGDTMPGGQILFFSYGPRAFPIVAKEPKLIPKNVRIEYSLSKNFALGLNYSPQAECEVHGYKKIILTGKKDPYYNIQYYSELFLSAAYKGNTYYLTAALMPLPNTFFNRLSFKLGAGVGLSSMRVNYRTSDLGFFSAEYSQTAKFSMNGLALLSFLELGYYFNRRWSLGISAAYQYVPVKVPFVEMKGYYYDLDVQTEELFHSSMIINILEQKINLGGWSLGVILGFHF